MVVIHLQGLSFRAHKEGGSDTTIPMAGKLPAANNSFSNAVLLSGTTGSLTGHNINATLEDNNEWVWDGHTVWYKFVAPSDQFINFTISAANAPDDIVSPAMTLFLGTDISTISYIDSRAEYGSYNFFVTGGETYYLQIDSYAGIMGYFTLEWDFT